MNKKTEINIQEIFNKVIEKGYYNEEDEFMCHSLENAEMAGEISQEEYKKACDSIEEYLEEIGNWSNSGSITLQISLASLSGYKEKWPFHERLAIYLDWENRPQPWKQRG